MHPENVGAVFQRQSVEAFGPPPGETLVRYPHKNRFSEAFEYVQIVQKFQVLCFSLGEAESGIKYPIVHTGRPRAFGEGIEI